MSEPDTTSKERYFPYYCERCKSQVRLAMKLVGHELLESSQAGITVACDCYQEPLATNTDHQPSHWVLDLDEEVANDDYSMIE